MTDPKRIYDLTENTAPVAGEYLVIDKSGYSEAKKLDVSKVAILAGQAGGQTLYGGTASNENIIIHGTAHSTRTTSYVLLQPTAGNVGIGTTTPVRTLDVHGTVGLTTTEGGLLATFSGANGFSFGNEMHIDWYDGTVQDSNCDLIVWRANAGVLGVKMAGTKSSPQPMALNISNYFANGGVNQEYAALYWAANTFFIGTLAAGDGVATPIQFTGVNGDTWQITAAGDFLANADDTKVIGNSAHRPLSITIGTGNSSFAGQLGVGTDNPQAKLHVSGATIAFPATSGTTQTGLNLRLQNTGSSGILDIGANSASGAWLQATNLGNLALVYPILLNPNGGNIGIGTTAPASLLHANLADAGTNAVATAVTIGHNSSDTPAAGFGSRVSWLLNSSTTDDQPAAALDVAWNVATHATRTSRIVLSVISLGASSTFLHNYADATADGDNTFLGIYAGNSTLSPGGGASSLASANVAVGGFSQFSLTTGYQNTSVGKGSTVYVTTGYRNTAVGAYTLNACTTGYGNVALGIAAGFYETGSNKLFIDNAQRASEADGRAKALIYGVFDAAVANQEITFNVGKHGFFGQAAVAKPTGVAVSAAGIHAALVTLGLIAA